MVLSFLNNIEKEALSKGQDISSDEFQSSLLELKIKILEKKGLTLDEYSTLREKYKNKILIPTDFAEKRLSEKAKEISDGVNLIVESLSNKLEEYYKELEKLKARKPDVINKIVKEKIVEKPTTQIIKETIEKLDTSHLEEIRKDIYALQESFINIFDNINSFSEELLTYKDLPEQFKKMSEDVVWAMTRLKMHTTPESSFNESVADTRYYTKGQVDNEIADIDINAQTDSYTLIMTDRNKLITMNKASANSLTVPPNSSVAFPLGTKMLIIQLGAGSTTIVAGSGVTISNPSSVALAIAEQNGSRAIVKTATNIWQII